MLTQDACAITFLLFLFYIYCSVCWDQETLELDVRLINAQSDVLCTEVLKVHCVVLGKKEPEARKKT